MIAAGLEVVFKQKGHAMRLRSLLCGLVFAGMAQGASAADLGDSFLRGAAVINPGGTRWDGFYFGGQVGANVSGADFSRGTRDLISFILRESTLNNIANVPDWGVLGKGLALQAAWVAIFGALAWSRFTTADVSS